MEITFPFPVKVQSAIPQLQGLRLNPFTNVDGETFAQPTLNGFWRLNMQVGAHNMQSHLALDAFLTAMEAPGAECVVPVFVKYRPLGNNGRMLARGGPAAPWTADHVGFTSEPFNGFTLRAAAEYRDSFIDVNMPALSRLWPGHYISLGDRLHKVVNVTPLAENARHARVSVMPNLRAAHAAGTVVIVDQLRLRCTMESGDPIGAIISPFQQSALSLLEAF